MPDELASPVGIAGVVVTPGEELEDAVALHAVDLERHELVERDGVGLDLGQVGGVVRRSRRRRSGRRRTGGGSSRAP